MASRKIGSHRKFKAPKPPKKTSIKEKRVSVERREKLKVPLIIAGIVLFVLLVMLGSFRAMRKYIGSVEKDVICNNITIGDIDVSGMKKSEAKKALEEQLDQYKSKTMTIHLTGGDVSIYLKDIGFDCPDLDKLVQTAVDYGKKGGTVTRYRQMKLLEKEPYVLEEKFTIDDQAAQNALEEQAVPLLQTATDAVMTVSADGTTTVEPEKDGETIDMKVSIENLSQFIENEWDGQDFTFDLEIVTDKPSVTAETLSELTDVLGEYSTDAGGGERWTNLKTGVGKLNGTLLMPGEELSVYDTTAPYDEEHGYAQGTAYENGQVVPSWGGGICQVSTTLYNAVILAELEVTERYPHSMLVDYVSPSMDAAIAGGSMDFKFKNPYDTPIYIFGEIDEQNQLRVKIYGKETRPENRTIEFMSETLSTEEYSVVYQASESLAFGEMEYSGSPHTGCEAQLWKLVYIDGVLESKELFNTSSYSKSDQIVKVGIKGGSSAAISALETAIASQDPDAIYSAINSGSGSSDNSDNSDEE